MSDRVRIPEKEYFERISKASKLVQEAGLDVLISNCTEADYSFVRYFTNYWPLFEYSRSCHRTKWESRLDGWTGKFQICN